jgi:hypothetical protein
MMIIGSVLQCIQGQQGRSMICGKINIRKIITYNLLILHDNESQSTKTKTVKLFHRIVFIKTHGLFFTL